MQISRLFEMVYLLMEREDVTASMLAKRFEVSTRTIYRDVETLSQAGIPVYTTKGKGGGIRLLPDFVLNKSVLSRGEQDEILYALQGLAATGAAQDGQVLSRLSALFHRERVDWIDVDFSHWGSGSREKEKFLTLKEGILSRRVLRFLYYNAAGQHAQRRVEPSKLRFKNYDWYLQGYSLEREAYRVFKLSRMEQVELTDELCQERAPAPDNLDAALSRDSVNSIEMTLHFSPKVAYRVWDEYEKSQVHRNADGSFTVHAQYLSNDQWMLSHLLSYGDAVEVLSPPEIRRQLTEVIEAVARIYSGE